MLISAASLPASAAAATRVDLKVLLLGISTTDPNFQSWQSALQREGVPFDTIIASAGHTPITSSTLSTTLSDGTQEAKYQAVIVSVGGLSICTTTCVSGLAQTEWNALETYEQTFAVREIDGDAFPSASYGLNAPTMSGTMDGIAGTLTADGLTNFPYLKGPFLLGTYPANPSTTTPTTFGWQATPISTTNFDTLVTGPSNAALVGIYTDPNGVQRLVETYNQNAQLIQAQLLQHGALAWVTRGVYFGDQRNYLETNIDDNFLADDTWDMTNKVIDYNPADAIREQPADVDYAATWSAQNNFRIDQLFNGGGSEAYAEGCTLTAGGGGSGSGRGCAGTAPNTDPLLAEFTKTCTSNCGPGNVGAGKPYTASFGWINHTWDHPNVDQGCATQNYIEAEIQQNTAWSVNPVAPTPGDPNNGGLGLTSTTDPAVALGAENPGVAVTGEHSGLANLTPGNPGTVDPPIFNSATPNPGGAGTLPTGTYTYAMTDQFTPAGGESLPSALVSATLTAPGSVTLSFDAACHASDIKIYRTTNPTSGPWTLVTTVNKPATDPANAWFADPLSITDTTNGGALVLSQVDSGGGSTTVPAMPTTNGAVESGYQQDTQLAAAFTAIGLKVFGTDSSKAYPNPATATFTPGTYTGPTYPAGSTWPNVGAQAEPRYPTNIYYNVSTEQQEVDEYNHLYLPPSLGGICQNSSTTTCISTPATFAQTISSVDQNMFQHLMANDPRPDYFHQTNMMGQPPAGAPNGAPPSTDPKVGDGLFYTTMNGLLAEYNTYFNVPVQQLTMAAITNLLVQQANWAANTQVSGYIQGNQVTVTNSGATAATIPLTGIPTIGSAYGGTTSGRTSAAAGATTYTSATTWPNAGIQVAQAPQGTWVGQSGSGGYLLAGWDGSQDLSDLPNISASLTQGTRTLWAQNTAATTALQAPDGMTVKQLDGSFVRNASAYTNPTAVIEKLTFTNAYSGLLSVYALDWKNEGDAQSLSVDDGSGARSVSISGFSNGDWATFPINVAAGGTVTITATKTAGTQAEISAITVGGAGAPPATGGQELSQGGWVSGVGAAGYDLAGWNGSSDLSVMPNVTVNLVQGSRYIWAANTTDTRALSDPNQTTRKAAAYYDPNQIKLQLTFSQAYTGNLHLYAVDWDIGTGTPPQSGRRELITVNGQTDSLSSDFSQGAWVTFPITVAANGVVTITVDRTAGPNAALSGLFLGDSGAPPAAPPVPTTSPQGNWVNTYGVGGWDLAAWNNGADSMSMPGVSVTLAQGSQYQWATNTTDARALANTAGSARNAAAYYDPNQIKVNLGFTNAYSGNLELYAVDWDSGGRRETITVNGVTATLGSDFSQGAWVTFPITVAPGGIVAISVNRAAGTNAVLSGIFLGGSGVPPAGPPVPTQSPQGSWVQTYGSAGYTLAGWNGGNDVTSMPGVTGTLVQGAPYEWAAGTADVRALANAAGTVRNASTYYDANEIRVQLNFSTAYTGNLHLYAVDWDGLGRHETITVGGVTANLAGDFSQGAWVAFPLNQAANSTLTITVDRTAGPNAVLSGIFLGDAGNPPAGPVFPSTSPQGNWVGTYGSSGYVLAAWNGGADVLSGTTASISVIQGTNYEWASNSTDPRALANSTGTARNAAAYYDPNQIKVQLTFSAAFTGNLELYAVDWDSNGRRETITVGSQTGYLSNDFSQGAWTTFPITVNAGGTVTILVANTAGPNAVLSGIFLN